MNVLLIFLALFGIPAALLAIHRLRMAKRRLQVKGTVIKSELKKVLGDWRPDVLVVYTIDGVDYTVDRFFDDDRTHSWRAKGDVERFIARYPVRSAVNVGVNPERHDVAYIDPERSDDWVNVPFYVVASLCSIWLLIAKPDPRMAFIGCVIIPLTAGCAFAISGWQRRKRALETLHWPATDGRILWSDIDRTSLGVSPPRYSRPVVRYVYHVAGLEYFGNEVFVGSNNWGYSARFTARLVARYPSGVPVKVHYDPDQPARAVLVRGDQTLARHHLGLSAICFAVVPVQLWMAFRIPA